MAIVNTGYLTYGELSGIQRLPDAKRYAAGPVAVIECIQEIPCNPCEAACRYGAIKVGDPITNLPELEDAKCIGCAVCVAKCPGLAIFVVDKSYSETVASVTFPYEYSPVPKQGEKVMAADRAGAPLCEAVVKKVVSTKAFDRTPLVTIEAPAEFADEARGIVRGTIG